MSVIDEFISRYQRELDYYERVANLCAQQCEVSLERSGIRAIVTSRAKRIDRLRDKLIKRNAETTFSDIDAISNYIVDLSGVRIALYFPGDSDEVDRFIQQAFVVLDCKSFPEPPTSSKQRKKPSSPPSYEKQFKGYSAKHYRVRLFEQNLPDDHKRYAQARIEIQVASVLMHAWSEVEHDLVYKPLAGELSRDEYEILDQINGLVLSGEMALALLQRAVNTRVSKAGQRFNNHYELSSYLYNTLLSRHSAVQEPIIGRADIFLRFLQLSEKDHPQYLQEYLDELDSSSNRPIVEQLVDSMLAEDDSLYEKYAKAHLEVARRNPYSSSDEEIVMAGEQAIGYFISRWIVFERSIRQAAEIMELGKLPWTSMFSLDVLKQLGVTEHQDIATVDALKRLRNQLVHGREQHEDEQLIDAGNAVISIMRKWQQSASQSVMNIINTALHDVDGQPIE